MSWAREPDSSTSPQDVAFDDHGHLFVVDDARVQVFDAKRQLVGTWPDEASTDHLGALAIFQDRVWVEAPYSNTFFELSITTS